MEIRPGQKIILIAFSMLCLACVFGIGFVLFDAVFQATSSRLQAVGAVSVFAMVVGLAARLLWNTRAQ